MKQIKPSNDPVEVIEQEALAVARCFGIAASDEMAAALVDRILLRLGGAQLYLPRRSTRARQHVRLEIARRFNGRNIDELARDLAVTTRYVRKIVSGRSGQKARTDKSRSEVATSPE